MPIFLDVMKEELERNLYKQNAFKEELAKLPSGYLSECVIDGKSYIYRKKRIGNKIISEYIGVPGDNNVKLAESIRRDYLNIKQSLKNLKNEEIKLRRAIKDYEKL